jgi:hypothetical protein
LSRRRLPLAVAAGAVAALALAVPAAQACTSDPALVPEAMTGWESGRKGYSNWTFTSAGTGGSIDPVTARSGSYSLRVAAAGASQNQWHLWETMPRAGVARVAVRLESLPASDVAQLLAIDTAYYAPRSSARVGYDAATQQLRLTVEGKDGARSTVAGPPAVAGAWHVIDLRHDVSTATHTADWAVDGVAQPSTSVATAGAEALYRVEIGTNSATDVFTANYDDVMLSAQAGDFPIGDGRVLPLKPNGMGASAGTANVRDDDGTPVDASSWARLDETPAISTADYVQQTAASTTSYAEIAFEDTAAPCIRAVRGHWSTHSVATNGSSHAKLSVLDGAHESVLRSGDFAANNAYSRDYSASARPAGGSWSTDSVNRLVARFGHSTDVRPVPMLDSVLLEVEVPAQ